MARSSNLSQRIERFLNDSNFRQSFAAGRRRALLAMLLVPAALFAAASLVRVEAASPAPSLQAAQAPVSGQANPDQAAEAVPAPPSPAAMPVPPPPPPMPQPAPAAVRGELPEPQPAAAPGPFMAPRPEPAPQGPPQAGAPNGPPPPPAPPVEFVRPDDERRYDKYKAYGYSFRGDGSSYAIIDDENQQTHTWFSGDREGSHEEDIAKARALAKGKFLWFTRDNKPYYIDDPALLAQIEELYKPMKELGEKQRALGEQQRALGQKMREQFKVERPANITVPDLSNQMAELKASLAKLDALKGTTVPREQLAELQGKLGEMQGQLARLQSGFGEWDAVRGKFQAEFGEQQGKLGEQQGKLGAEQGKIAREADRTVHTIIDQSLQNGKAHPVQ